MAILLTLREKNCINSFTLYHLEAVAQIVNFYDVTNSCLVT